MERKRKLELGFIAGIVFVLLVFLGIMLYEKKCLHQIDDLIILVERAHRDNGAKQELIEYETIVLNKLENLKNRIELRECYVLLGYIEKMKGNPVKSNEYFFKAIRLGEIRHEKLNTMLYCSISTNYMQLGEIKKSQEYFQKADAIARGYEVYDLLSLVYRARANVLTSYNSSYSESIDLLQKALYVSSDPINTIESNLQLALIYLNTFLDDSAINYSMSAVDLATIHNLENYQKISFIILGTAYYLNQEYEKSVSIFEKVLMNFPDSQITEYIVLLIVSYWNTNGIEYAMSKLEEYQPLVQELVFKGDTVETEKWLSLVKASIYLRDNQNELALQYWIQGNDDYEGELQSIHEHWRNFIYYSIQLNNNSNETEVLTEMYKIYEATSDYSSYPVLKREILETLIDSSVELGNYEMAYQYTQERLIKFTAKTPQGISAQDLYAWLNEETDFITFNQRHLNFLKWFAHITCWIILGYTLNNYYRDNKLLKKKLEAKSFTEPVTDVLTIPSFYQCLELWDGMKKEVYFLAIDIDCFEKYNQTYGILAGESVLKELSKCIKKAYPTSLITRMKGCQFIVAQCGSEDEVILKAQQLIEEVYQLNVHHVTNLGDERITISIGISGGSNITSRLYVDKQIETAQQCLKEAKQKGKNTLVI